MAFSSQPSAPRVMAGGVQAGFTLWGNPQAVEDLRPFEASAGHGIDIDLQLLTPVDRRMLRAARLDALLDSPHAFTPTYVGHVRWSGV
jgi:hypothetical protein